MSPLVHLVIILLFTLCCKSQIIIESATLQVSVTNDNSAQVNTNNIGYVDSTYGWTVNVQNNQGWHWYINFHHNKWKFKSDRLSTLTIKIYSASQFLSNDRDIIIVFSQNNAKYLTTIIQLDNNPNKIYPNCGASFATGNIEQTLNINNGQDREQKTMNNNRNFNLQPQNNISSCCQNSSPMIMKIVNNPVAGWSQYIYENSPNSGWRQTCRFTEPWSSNDYLDIFVMGQEIGEDLNILRFELSMHHTKRAYPSTTFTYEQTMSSTSTTELLWSTPSSSQSTPR